MKIQSTFENREDRGLSVPHLNPLIFAYGVPFYPGGHFVVRVLGTEIKVSTELVAPIRAGVFYDTHC